MRHIVANVMLRKERMQRDRVSERVETDEEEQEKKGVNTVHCTLNIEQPPHSTNNYIIGHT